MNYTDFSAKIKAKYPDYASVDDLTLAQKMVAKFPEYKDLVEFGGTPSPADTTAVAAPVEPKKGFLDTVLGGIGGVGKAINGAINEMPNTGAGGMVKPILQIPQYLSNGVENAAQRYVQMQKEGAPGITNAPAAFANATIGNAFGAGSKAVGKSLYASGTDKEKKLLDLLLQGSGKVAGPVVQSYEKNTPAVVKNLVDIASADIGGGIAKGPAGEALRSVGKAIPETAENLALGMAGRGRRIIGKDLKSQRNMIKTTLEEKLPSNNGEAADVAGKKIGDIYHELKNSLDAVKDNPATQIDHLGILDRAIETAKKKDYSGNLAKYDAMKPGLEEGIKTRFGENGVSDIADAQVEKEAIGHNQYTPTTDPRESKIFNELYMEYKKAIEDAAARGGNEDVQALNKKMSNLIEARVGLSKRAKVEERNNFIPLDQYIGLAAAAAGGHGLPLVLPAAQGVMKSKGLAQMLYDLANTGKKNIADFLPKIEKTAQETPAQPAEIPAAVANADALEAPAFARQGKSIDAAVSKEQAAKRMQESEGRFQEGKQQWLADFNKRMQESEGQKIPNAIRGLRPQVSEQQAMREAMMRILTGGGEKPSGKGWLGNERGAIGGTAQQPIHSENFKQWFGDWEKAPETASKVVDESGKPKDRSRNSGLTLAEVLKKMSEKK